MRGWTEKQWKEWDRALSIAVKYTGRNKRAKELAWEIVNFNGADNG